MNLKDYLRYLLPAVASVALGIAGARLLQGLEAPQRFGAGVLLLGGLCYGLAWLSHFNHRLDVEARARAAGVLPSTASLAGPLPRWPLPGLLALATAVVLVAAGLAWGGLMPWSLLAGGGLWWWSDRHLAQAGTVLLGERLQAMALVTPSPAADGQPLTPTRPAAAVAPAPAPVDAAAARQAALMRAIEEKKKEDPLIGAKLGARELNQRLLAAMKGERGVHIESLLTALGALAGYACQVSLRNEALSRGESANAPFTVVQDSKGRRYFFGDALNQRLVEDRRSVWNIATATVRKEGLQALPDLEPIFRHVADSVGNAHFGLPRCPEGHDPGDLPLHYVQGLWPVMLPVVRQFSPQPIEWPILFGFALQEALRMSRDVLAPEVALVLVMESAIPMSKVDLQTA